MNIAPDGLGYMQDCNADRVKKGARVGFVLIRFLMMNSCFRRDICPGTF